MSKITGLYIFTLRTLFVEYISDTASSPSMFFFPSSFNDIVRGFLQIFLPLILSELKRTINYYSSCNLQKTHGFLMTSRGKKTQQT